MGAGVVFECRENELGQLEAAGLGAYIDALYFAVGRIAMPQCTAAKRFTIASCHEEMDICRGQRFNIDEVIAFRRIELVEHLIKIADQSGDVRRAWILAPDLDFAGTHGWKACS